METEPALIEAIKRIQDQRDQWHRLNVLTSGRGVINVKHAAELLDYLEEVLCGALPRAEEQYGTEEQRDNPSRPTGADRDAGRRGTG